VSSLKHIVIGHTCFGDRSSRAINGTDESLSQMVHLSLSNLVAFSQTPAYIARSLVHRMLCLFTPQLLGQFQITIFHLTEAGMGLMLNTTELMVHRTVPR